MACRQRVDADEEGPLARMVVAVGADAPGGGELVCKRVVWRGGSEAHAMEGGGQRAAVVTAWHADMTYDRRP